MARCDMKKNVRTFFSPRALQRLCALVLSLLVLLTLFLSALLFDKLESRYALQKDFSFNGATTQSRIATEQLQALDKDVHIYVLMSAGGRDNTLLSLLTRYAAITPHLTFSEENAAQNPMLLTAFEDVLTQQQVQSDCLIIHCKSTDRARVLTAESFVTYQYDTESGYYIPNGVNYDKPLIEAIVYTAQNDPMTVQLLRGHGEASGEDLETVTKVLTQANYRMEEVDLLKGGVLDVSRPLLILCPQTDLSEKELLLLMDFANAGGDFFIISDYTDPLDNANYNAFLRAFGVSFYQGLVMAEEDDRQSYYDEGQAFLMPRMQETALTRPLIEQARDTLLLPGSRAVRLPETPPEGVTVETQLVTGRSYIRDYVAVEPDMVTKQPTDEEGYFALSVLSSRVTEEGNVSRALVTGNAEMFTHWWIEENTYSADYLLRGISYLQGESPISLDISGKSAVRQGLTLYSLAPLIVVITLLPLAILAWALCMLLPRRHL